MKRSFVPYATWLLLPALAAFGCGGGNNLLEGRVEADVAGHHVVVTDCYRFSPPGPERLADQGGLPAYRYAPCRDAVLMLRGDELEVNGRSYGVLGAGDAVLVDHGAVSIHGSGASQARADHE